jgi:hypothetical protein
LPTRKLPTAVMGRCGIASGAVTVPLALLHGPLESPEHRP